MNTDDLWFIDSNGKLFGGEVMQPFFKYVRNILLEKPNEIRICFNCRFSGKEPETVIEYVKSGKTYTITPLSDFNPFVANSRIKILAKLSITENQEMQTGIINMLWCKNIIPTAVDTFIKDGRELLILKPKWEVVRENLIIL